MVLDMDFFKHAWDSTTDCRTHFDEVLRDPLNAFGISNCGPDQERSVIPDGSFEDMRQRQER